MEDANSTSLRAKFQDLDQLWNLTDVSGSEAAYRALLTEGQKLVGRDRCFLIELYSLIARSEALQEKFVEARSSLDAAEALLEWKQRSLRGPFLAF